MPGWPPQGATVRIAGVTPARGATDTLKATLARFGNGSGGVAAAPAAAVRPAMTAVEDDLLAATRHEAAAGAKLVIWPENAVRTREPDEAAAIAAAQRQARRSDVHLETGVRVHSTAPPAYGRDEALLIDPAARCSGPTRRPIPFPGPSASRRATAVSPSSAHHGRLAGVICYDADFPALMRTRADTMLVRSHDWKEYGAAHTGKAGLRAVENGYALIRQDAEGLSATYDAEGHVLASRARRAHGHRCRPAPAPGGSLRR
ncbi:hypothetical protein [Streptomyces sp. NPDC054783]